MYPYSGLSLLGYVAALLMLIALSPTVHNDLAFIFAFAASLVIAGLSILQNRKPRRRKHD